MWRNYCEILYFEDVEINNEIFDREEELNILLSKVDTAIRKI